MQGLWPWLNHFGLGLFWLKADILHSSSSAFLASVLFRGGVCVGSWLLYAQLFNAAQRSGGPAGGELGRAGLCKERKCGEKERTDCSPVAGMSMEMTVILRMNDSHADNMPGDLSVSAVGIVLKKVKLFSGLLLKLFLDFSRTGYGQILLEFELTVASSLCNFMSH